jgi:hypothetical protein
MAGGLAFKNFELAITGLKELVLNPELRNDMSEKAVKYAEEFSWRNQALEHFKLAERLCHSRVQHLLPTLPLGTLADATGKPVLTVSDKIPSII